MHDALRKKGKGDDSNCMVCAIDINLLLKSLCVKLAVCGSQALEVSSCFMLEAHTVSPSSWPPWSLCKRLGGSATGATGPGTLQRIEASNEYFGNCKMEMAACQNKTSRG